MSYHRIAVAAAAFALAATAGAAGTSTAPSAGASSSNDTSASRPMDSQSAAPGGQYDASLIRSVQQALKQQGHDTGAADGQWNASTETAVRDFQASKGLPQTGNLDQPTLSALGVASGSGRAATPMSRTSPSSNTGSTTRSSPSSSTGTSGSAKY